MAKRSWFLAWGLSQKTFSVVKACSVLFCCLAVLVWGLATPWTYFLHLSLSSAILTDSSTESPIHDLMLSIQAVRGLPRLRTPGIVPCIISFSRQFPGFLMMWPQYASFLVLTVSNSSLFTPALLRTHSFVFCAVHETRRIFLSPFISKSSRRVSSFFLSVVSSFDSRTWLQTTLALFLSYLRWNRYAVTFPYFLQWCPDFLPST